MKGARPHLLLSLLPLSLGCGGKGVGADTLLGEVVAERAGEAATVEAASAWSWSEGGTATLLLSGNPDATCVDAAAAMGVVPDGWSPAAVIPPGTCSVFVTARYDGGPFSDAASADAPTTASTVTLNCAMDTGAWAASGDGYEYDGSYWIGSPRSYTLTLDGAEALSWGLSADDHDGNFLYESMDDAPASGHLEGAGEAQPCPDMAGSIFY